MSSRSSLPSPSWRPSSFTFAGASMSGFRFTAKEPICRIKRRSAPFSAPAPNGNGQSGMIDALEFMFSKDGTLDRLGIRTINNNAGVVALAHNLAEEAKLSPDVTISFIVKKNVTSGSRPAAGSKRLMPEIAATVNSCFTVSPIIRGHALRTFVDLPLSGRHPLAGLARTLWRPDQDPYALLALGQERRVEEAV